MSRLYFAYGSNLNIEQMLVRCPTAEVISPLCLNHWRLVFRRVADIEPARNSQVFGGLYSVLPEDERALDNYEGIAVGLYSKVDIRLADGRDAFMYLMNSRQISPPPYLYYQTILEGYRDWGFDEKHLRLAMIAAVGSRVDPRFDAPAGVSFA